LSGECARCAIASDFSTQECSRSRVWSSEIQQCGRVILVPSIYFLGGLVRHGSDDRFVAMTELLNQNLVNENCRSAHGESHDTLLTSASGLLFRMVYMFSQYSQSGFRDDRQLLRFERHYLNGVSHRIRSGTDVNGRHRALFHRKGKLVGDKHAAVLLAVRGGREQACILGFRAFLKFGLSRRNLRSLREAEILPCGCLLNYA
jgi:hypothetical protein